MAWPAVNRAFTQEQFRKYVEGLTWGGWRPSLLVWHNTAAPSLKQWIVSAEADARAGKVPGSTRIGNLDRYFRVDNGWPGSPHLFVAHDLIWVMNTLTAPGTHSPSWNGIAWGIEMVGDFSREDDDAGVGLQVKLNTIYATAVMCEAVGLDPATQIRLHKQDPRTTHDCPGKDIAEDKLKMIQAVQDLMSGGEHQPSVVAEVIAGGLPQLPEPHRFGVVTTNGLNFRRGPSASSESTGQLPAGTKVVILDKAANATTSWLKVKTPAGYIGWVAGKYVKEGE